MFICQDVKMKKLTFIIILLSLVIFSNGAYAKYRHDIPIWKQVEKLICMGEYWLTCNKNKCIENKSTARWLVDFIEEKVTILPATEGILSTLKGSLKKKLNSELTYNFHGKYFEFYTYNKSGMSSILLHGNVIRFGLDKSTDNIKAVVPNGMFKGVKRHPNPVFQTAKLGATFFNCSAPNTSETTSRLKKLRELEDAGLITKKEAAEKRKAILDSL
jgi:hypothetical protein